jgi:hypothetical protein
MMEEEFLDVLQNIESTIVKVFNDHPELTDYEVNRAVEALLKSYQGESAGKPASPPDNELAKQVFSMVREICEWRLGRGPSDEPVFIEMEPKTVNEIILCLKRIRKSIDTWNKRGGRQGYLAYIKNFTL